MNRPAQCFLLLALSFLTVSPCMADDDGFTPLFPEDGAPKGWVVRAWNDLAKEPGGDTEWMIKDGVLSPGKTRGTWLVSELEYGDFILDFEIKLTEVGNSGVALRAPLKDDPAFVAMEMQVADLRYNTSAKDFELTGAIYRALAPKKQVYKPTDWNHVRIELRASHREATLYYHQNKDFDHDTSDKREKRN
jgi:hypothetical protein